MSTTHSLNLLENAIDYLNEAVKYYDDARTYNEERLYKFCILHVVNFAELFIKHYVSLESELLIYEKPHETIKDNSKTITLDKEITVLKNLQKPEIESIRIEYLKNLRNDATHFKIEYDIEKVDNAFGQLLYELMLFDEANANVDIIKHAKKEYREVLNIIRGGYIDRLEQAKEMMDEKEKEAKKHCRRMKDELYIDFEKGLMCENCGNATLIKNNGKYECTFCKDEPEYMKKCNICGEVYDSYEAFEDVGLCSYHEHVMSKDD